VDEEAEAVVDEPVGVAKAHGTTPVVKRTASGGEGPPNDGRAAGTACGGAPVRQPHTVYNRSDLLVWHDTRPRNGRQAPPRIPPSRPFSGMIMSLRHDAAGGHASRRATRSPAPHGCAPQMQPPEWMGTCIGRRAPANPLSTRRNRMANRPSVRLPGRRMRGKALPKGRADPPREDIGGSSRMGH